MMGKVTAYAGSIVGWVGAFDLIWVGETRQAVLAQAALLAVGICSTAWLMLNGRNRPMSAAFELGYEMGRRDAIREGAGAKVLYMRPRLDDDRQHAAN